MLKYQLFSRRPKAAVDFRPYDMEPESPSTQVRRLTVYLSEDEHAGINNIEDCPEALNALREYTYRKIFTNTSHEDFVALDKKDPEIIDWLVAVHEIDAAAHQQRKPR